MIVELPGDILVEIAARFFEHFGGVRGQGVRPEIAIVARGIAVAGENVCEVRCAMTHHNFAGHAEFRQRLAFERIGIDVHVAGQMEFHVHQRARQILDRGKPLVERLRLFDLVEQLLRHRFTGFVVQSE